MTKITTLNPSVLQGELDSEGTIINSGKNVKK